MAVTQDAIDSFHRFATECLHPVGADVSMDELYDQWRLDNATVEEQETDALAVKAALLDMENGDRGIPLDDHMRQVREKLGIPSAK